MKAEPLYSVESIENNGYFLPYSVGRQDANYLSPGASLAALCHLNHTLSLGIVGGRARKANSFESFVYSKQ